MTAGDSHAALRRIIIKNPPLLRKIYFFIIVDASESYNLLGD
jgi:hypothetical protein